MREALAEPELPEEATRLVVEVLRLVCGDDAKGEREFCAVVLEAVAEVHDAIMDDHTEAGEGESSVEDS
ncbi:chromosome condensation complex Condensin, subunit G, partial [Teratosphaeriaceae sp. CCFEE 6253]